MTSLVHFEITATDPVATAGFYAQVLGMTSAPSPFVPNYLLLTGADGPMGAVMDNSYKDQKTIIWFGVTDLDATLAAIIRSGGAQAGDINSIPGQGRLVYASDPNGTIFGLKQAEAA